MDHWSGLNGNFLGFTTWSEALSMRLPQKFRLLFVECLHGSMFAPKSFRLWIEFDLKKCSSTRSPSVQLAACNVHAISRWCVWWKRQPESEKSVEALMRNSIWMLRYTHIGINGPRLRLYFVKEWPVKGWFEYTGMGSSPSMDQPGKLQSHWNLNKSRIVECFAITFFPDFPLKKHANFLQFRILFLQASSLDKKSGRDCAQISVKFLPNPRSLLEPVVDAGESQTHSRIFLHSLVLLCDVALVCNLFHVCARQSPPVSNWLAMCSIFETMFTSFAPYRSLKQLPFTSLIFSAIKKRLLIPLVAITVTLSQFRFLALLPEIWQAADPLGTHSGNASWGKTVHDYCGVQVLALISTSC